MEGTRETATSTPTIGSSPPSSDGDTTKKGNKSKGELQEEEDETDKESNLVGKITNLVSTDLDNILDGRDFLMLIVSLPLDVTLCIVFLYKILGWSAIVGMVTMIALYPIPGWLGSKMQDIQDERMKIVSYVPLFTLGSALTVALLQTDSRVQVVTEVMNVIRMIKLFGWEKRIDEKIAVKREEELAYQKKGVILEIIANVLKYV